MSDAHANPAKPDAPPVPYAVVTTAKDIVRRGFEEFHIPPGTVTHVRVLPAVHTFQPGRNRKLIPVGSYKVGDIVEG